MGHIKGWKISLEKVKEIVSGKKFHIFVHNQIRKGMQKNKMRIGRSEPTKLKSIQMTDFQDMEL
jgi:hypothetical protein